MDRDLMFENDAFWVLASNGHCRTLWDDEKLSWKQDNICLVLPSLTSILSFLNRYLISRMELYKKKKLSACYLWNASFWMPPYCVYCERRLSVLNMVSVLNRKSKHFNPCLVLYLLLICHAFLVILMVAVGQPSFRILR